MSIAACIIIFNQNHACFLDRAPSLCTSCKTCLIISLKLASGSTFAGYAIIELRSIPFTLIKYLSISTIELPNPYISPARATPHPRQRMPAPASHSSSTSLSLKSNTKHHKLSPLRFNLPVHISQIPACSKIHRASTTAHLTSKPSENSTHGEIHSRHRSVKEAEFSMHPASSLLRA
jgi:hypothetical protein